MILSKNIPWLLSCLLLLGSTPISRPSKPLSKLKDNAKKVVFISSRDSHERGEHEVNGGIKLLAQKLKEGAPNLDTLLVHYDWPTDPSVLQNAATLVLFCDGGDGHMITPHMKTLDSMMRTGTGLVMIHFSLEIQKGADGNALKNLVGGYFETDWSVNPVWEPKFEQFPVHPITRGITPFSVRDEWYYHMRFVENSKRVTPILSALPPVSTLSRPDGTHSGNPTVRDEVIKKKQPQTMAWAFRHPGGGRGFGFTGGHYHQNWQNDNFRKLVLNAILWTAQAEVPPNGVLTTTPSAKELDRLARPVK